MTQTADYLFLLQVLGSLVFRQDGSMFLHLPEAEQRRIAALSIPDWGGSLLYYFLHDALPEGTAAILKPGYFNCSMQNMRHEAELAHFRQEMEEARIRYCMFKGADLAFRVYPAPALRPFCDWDVLFHPQDFRRALDLMRASGWVQQPNTPSAVHDAVLFRRNTALEPHWVLPGFSGITPEECSQGLRPVSPGSSRYELTPEMNAVMLCAHAGCGSYRYVSLARLLTDLAFLMQKTPFDWAAAATFAARWKVPSPAAFCAAWPEFFPVGTVPAAADAETARLLREIYMEGLRLRTERQWDILQKETAHYSLNFLRDRMAEFAPGRVFRRDPRMALRICFSKVCGLVRSIAAPEAPGVRRYFQLTGALECRLRKGGSGQ